MRRHSKTHRAFTLIELLAVIGIIALLVALLFPAIKGSLQKAEVAQAQTGISNLSTAFKAYYTEYGKWPINDTQPWDYMVDANMVALLTGADIGAGANPGPTKELDGAIVGPSGQFQGNPRKIAFLQVKQSDLGAFNNAPGFYLDPWKKPYYCAFDVTYVGSIPDPFGSAPTFQAITNGLIVWSDGPDGQENNQCGDPPGPYVTTPCANSDNVKSW
jgi:prepilin-type N-terminal cleavage/methylation domain-containing protein